MESYWLYIAVEVRSDFQDVSHETLRITTNNSTTCTKTLLFLTSLTKTLASQHNGVGGHWKHWTVWIMLWMSKSLWNCLFSSSWMIDWRGNCCLVLLSAMLAAELSWDSRRSRRRIISSASVKNKIVKKKVKWIVFPHCVTQMKV